MLIAGTAIWLACLAVKITHYQGPVPFFSDVPLLVLPLIAFIRFRKSITRTIRRVPLPRFALYLASSAPLIIFEENINCLPSECRLIPSTLTFLLVFMLLLGLTVTILRMRSALRATVAFSIVGLLFELTLGASHNQLTALLPSVPGILIALWVMVSYAFFAFIPLAVLTSPETSS
jgi:hypothetical protein